MLKFCNFGGWQNLRITHIILYHSIFVRINVSDLYIMFRYLYINYFLNLLEQQTLGGSPLYNNQHIGLNGG